MIRCRGTKQRLKVPKLAVRPFTYKGCIVSVMNNCTYSYRYEFRVEPIERLPRKNLGRRVLNDPTSWCNKARALSDGKDAAANLNRRMLPWRWNTFTW